MKKKIGIAVLIVIVLIASLYVVRSVMKLGVSTETTSCEVVKQKGIHITTHSECKKLTNGLSMEYGIFVRVNDDVAFIVSDQYLDLYDNGYYGNLEKLPALEGTFEGYSLKINYYFWEFEGTDYDPLATTIRSSYHLEKNGMHIIGMGPFKEIKKLMKDISKDQYGQIIEKQIKEIVKVGLVL